MTLRDAISSPLEKRPYFAKSDFMSREIMSFKNLLWRFSKNKNKN